MCKLTPGFIELTQDKGHPDDVLWLFSKNTMTNENHLPPEFHILVARPFLGPF
jgi:hypothetical protein